MKHLTSKQIYDMGYAIPGYDIFDNVRRWRFRSEEYTTPGWSVPMVEIPGCRFWVARIEDVRRNAVGGPVLLH